MEVLKRPMSYTCIECGASLDPRSGEPDFLCDQCIDLPELTTDEKAALAERHDGLLERIFRKVD